MNNELYRMWKEAVIVICKVLSWYSPSETNVCRSPGQGLSLESAK